MHFVLSPLHSCNNTHSLLRNWVATCSNLNMNWTLTCFVTAAKANPTKHNLQFTVNCITICYVYILSQIQTWIWMMSSALNYWKPLLAWDSVLMVEKLPLLEIGPCLWKEYLKVLQACSEYYRSFPLVHCIDILILGIIPFLETSHFCGPRFLPLLVKVVI